MYYVEPLNYSLWGKVANFTSSGMRSTYSLITLYQTSSEILTNKIVDPNLLKILLRENNNSTRLKEYPCTYLRSLPQISGLKKSSGHKGVNSSGHFFRVLVDNVWVNSSGNFCWVNSGGQCLGEF